MITITAKPHPLRGETYTCEVPSGTSLNDILPPLDGIIAEVNGERWTKWQTSLPDGQHILVYAKPENDAAWRAVLGAVVVAVSVWTGGLAAGPAGLGLESGSLGFYLTGGVVAATTGVAGPSYHGGVIQ